MLLLHMVLPLVVMHAMANRARYYGLQWCHVGPKVGPGLVRSFKLGLKSRAHLYSMALERTM